LYSENFSIVFRKIFRIFLKVLTKPSPPLKVSWRRKAV